MQKPNLSFRVIIAIFSATALLFVYLFQRVDVTAFFNLSVSGTGRFIFNRVVRFVLNDVFALGLIYALFPFRKYLVFSILVQATGLLIFLLPYLVLKVHYPSYNGPLINFLHRLILNPTLSILLVPAFYYKEKTARGERKNF
jgi:exosortase F-associated protein